MPEVPAGGTSRRSSERHAADPRAPYDRKGAEWLSKGAEHAKAGEWKEALELLQRVTERPEDSLFRTEGGGWVSVRAEVDRLRGEAPPELLAEYRTQYGGLARQLLTSAVQSGDPVALGRIARGYFHTEAGYEAANRLGSMHLDRGEFPLAAHWFATLWQTKAPVTNDRLWRAKAAFAFKQAGQVELAETVAADGNDAGRKPVAIGGTPRDPVQWLAEVARMIAPGEPVLADWLTFFGSPRRSGVVAGGEPLLLPRWRYPLTVSHPVRNQIDQLSEDLADQGIVVPTPLLPTMVAGKVIFRSLHGVQVVEAASGRLLWETEELQPLERMISGQGERNEFADEDLFGGGPVIRFRGRVGRTTRMNLSANAGEFSPLCNLLYRNANFGIVSSDGERLFVVDDPLFLSNMQPGNAWQWEGNRTTPRDAGSKLTAYDLASGRPRWEVGGAATGEPFEPPLAGHFFFGPPVADGGELYVVAEATAGERAGQIRLLALDPATGGEKWSQLIAHSDPAPIEKDIGRRWWPAPVAIDRGVLVCPTTVGWIVAIDRVTHSLLWGYRTAQPGTNPQRAAGNAEQHEAMAMVQNAPLAGMWGAAPPVLADGRVVVTPQESQNLICLDQLTGKELWSKPRGGHLYLAGVYEGKTLLVGREGITALELTSGAPAWKKETPPPSGRGVAVSGRYELPLSTGEVWSLDIKTGEVTGRSMLPAGVGSVGNLAMHRGMLLSLDASGMTAFEQRDAVQNEIASRLRENARDPWALIRQAEIRLLHRDEAEALAALRQISVEMTPPDLRERRRTLLVDALRSAIRANFERPQAQTDLRELSALAGTPEERRVVHQLEADLAVARGEFTKAFDAYLALADDESAPLVSRDDTPATTVRARVWIAGKLSDLIGALPADARAPLDERVAALAQKAIGQPLDAQERFLELFAGHPATISVRRQMAQGYAARGELVRAEHVLLPLARGSDRKVAADARVRLAQLMLQFDLAADAAELYRDLERNYGNTPLGEGGTAAQFVQALRDAGRFPDVGAAVVDWQASGIRVERTGASFQNHVPQELSATGSSAAYFQRTRFEIEHGRQRLEVSDIWSDERRWSLPLRNHAASAEGSLAIARSAGHQLAILYRGVVHCLSPVERKVLWTRPLDGRLGGPVNYGRNNSPMQPMQASISLASRQAYNQSLGVAGPLAIANEDYIVHQGRRNVTVLDARTGEVRWTYTGGRAGGSIFGGGKVLFLRPPDGRGAVALRASDGKRLEVDNLDETLNRAVHVVGDGFILPLSGGGLRLFDPVTGRDRWGTALGKSVLSLLENDRMAVLQSNPQGDRFQILDLRTGNLQILGTLSPDDQKGRSEQFAFADNQNVYLIVNKGMNANFSSEQVPSVRTNGLLMAFDPQRGKLRWKQPIAAQNLLLERLDSSPLLVFAARQHEQKGKLQFWSLHLLALDKLSGAKLLDEKSASQQGFRSINVSAAERYVELRGYNDRVRLYAIEKDATAGEAGD